MTDRIDRTNRLQSKPADLITAFCDGGSRGNPGPSGYGVFIQDERGETLGELSDFLGVKTNNVAEYSGLLAALNFAIEHGHPHLRVISDSELMVKQMQGKYRVNSPDLKPLYEEAKRRAALLKKFEMQHVLRGKNREADRLANEAMDRGTGRSRVQGPDGDTGRPSQERPDVPRRAMTGPAHSGSDFSERSARSTINSSPAPMKPSGEVTGFVKNGVVHLVEGQLPEGTFVRILPARR